MVRKYFIIGFLVGIIVGAVISFFYPPLIFQLLIVSSQVLPEQNKLWFLNRGSIINLLSSIVIMVGLIGGLVGLLVGKLRKKKV